MPFQYTFRSDDISSWEPAARDLVENRDRELELYSTTIEPFLVPTGSINMWATATAPTAWLLCDGTAISRTTYATLFAVISTTYGVGDGSTTFNLPNLKGKVPVGQDSTQTEFDNLGELGGTKTHTLTTAEMPVHTHIQDSHNHTQNSHNHTQDAHGHNFTSGAAFVAGPYNIYTDAFGVRINTGVTDSATATNQAQTATNIAATATNQNAGSGSAHNNLQPYIVLNYIIKT